MAHIKQLAIIEKEAYVFLIKTYWKYVKMLQIVMKKCWMRIPKVDEHRSQRGALLSRSTCGGGRLVMCSCFWELLSKKLRVITPH